MKPMPASRMQAPTCSALMSILTPSACSTSAAPDFDDSARLPCLATGTPEPVTINAAQVEMLNEPEASPPMPTTSIASDGACTPSILARMVVTAPVISSTVSPRTRNAMSSPPICEGGASPDIMRSKAEAASARVRLAPVATLAMSDLKSSAMGLTRYVGGRLARRRCARFPSMLLIPGGGEIEKILQHQMAVLGGDALGMELHAVHRQARMRETHHQAIVGFGIDGQLARHAGAFHHQRMIARGVERPVDAAEHAGAGVLDLEHLAVGRRRAHHFAAERLPDRLMPEADAEDRNRWRGLGDEIEADAGFVRGAGAGRQHDGFRLGGDHIGGPNLVVGMDDDVRPPPAQVMEQVEGEAVVVVDQNDHVFKPAQGLKTTHEGGQAGVISARCRAAGGASPACAGRFPRSRPARRPRGYSRRDSRRCAPARAPAARR